MIVRVLILLVASSALGLGYNAYREWSGLKALPWQPVELETVNDDELFAANNRQVDETEAVEQSESGIKKVTTVQVQKIVAEDAAILIDARNAEEFASGTIGNAINIFPEDDGSHIELLYALPLTENIVVFCSGGACDLSHRICEDLQMIGAESVFLYEGGFDEWQAAIQ